MAGREQRGHSGGIAFNARLRLNRRRQRRHWFEHRIMLPTLLGIQRDSGSEGDMRPSPMSSAAHAARNNRLRHHLKGRVKVQHSLNRINSPTSFSYIFFLI